MSLAVSRDHTPYDEDARHAKRARLTPPSTSSSEAGEKPRPTLFPATLKDARISMSPTPTPTPAPRTAPAMSLRTGNDRGPAATMDSPEEAWKMWLACADVGVMVLDTRSASTAVPESDWLWADDAADLVERAIEEGLVIAKKFAFTLLHARMATYQRNKKFSYSVLRRLIWSFAPNDPRAHHAHLALVSHLESDNPAALAALARVTAGVER